MEQSREPLNHISQSLTPEPVAVQAEARTLTFPNLSEVKVQENCPSLGLPDVALPAVVPPDTGSFVELNRVLQKWFYKPDLQAIRIVMGTLKAHYLDIGDPAWLFVVAPPGSGKTTVSIMGAAGLQSVNVLSDVTENTFWE